MPSYRPYTLLLWRSALAVPNNANRSMNGLPAAEPEPPASSSSPPPPAPDPFNSLPDDLRDNTFSLLSAADRGAAAAVCHSWFQADSRSRLSLTVRNCYAVDPQVAVEKFPNVRAAVVKGKPHFADFTSFLPPDWGAYALPWVEAAVHGWPHLEELSFKRMVVTDECLQMIAATFPNLKALRVNKCEGFSTTGLEAITQACRNLRELDLEESIIDNNPLSHWLTNFPESLETLNFSCLTWELNFTQLERLVSRCLNLKTLKLNNHIPLENVASLLRQAPQIVELGFGKFSDGSDPNLFANVKAAFAGCTSLTRLSGGWGNGDVPEYLPALCYLPAFSCICEGLTSLNLCWATTQGTGLIQFIRKCKNLQRLWVNDLIGEAGLSFVASTCSKLQELWVVLASNYGYVGPAVSVKERGLVAVSAQCPRLESVLYLCRRMTNKDLITVARNCANLTCFRFGLPKPNPDYITGRPFDAGFRAIVESCKGLRRLSVAGRLTDAGLRSIGELADSIEVLSLAFTGDSDIGLNYILKGCKSLKRLQITDCPFGGRALLANAARLETLRYLCMSSCKVTMLECMLLGDTMPRLTVEVRKNAQLKSVPPNSLVRSLYVYRTLAGPRSDTPESIQIASI